VALEAAELARAQALEHRNGLLLLQVGFAVEVRRLDVALVVVALEHDDVGGHQLVADDFDDLTHFQALPHIRLKSPLLDIRRVHFPFIFFFVLLVALPILEQVLQGRGHDHDYQGVRYRRSASCVAHSRDHLDKSKPDG